MQFGDCTWGMLADKNGQEMHAATKEGLLAVQNAYKDINNQVINGAPEGMNITTHVCRAITIQLMPAVAPMTPWPTFCSAKKM